MKKLKPKIGLDLTKIYSHDENLKKVNDYFTYSSERITINKK